MPWHCLGPMMNAFANKKNRQVGFTSEHVQVELPCSLDLWQNREETRITIVLEFVAGDRTFDAMDHGLFWYESVIGLMLIATQQL